MFRDSSKKITPSKPCETNRRDFTVRAIYGLASLIGISLSAPVTVYVFARPKSDHQTGWVDAGSIDKLPIGVPQNVPVLRVRVDGWKLRSDKDSVWIVRKSDGTVTAFSPLCTHLGCAYHWDESQNSFLCPCHGSKFSLSGKVIAGPAPRPLDQYAVRLEGDRVWLGELHQAGEPESHA